MRLPDNMAAKSQVIGTQGSRYVYWVTAVAALGGLLFGYDIAIINGALVFLKQQLGLGTLETELAVSGLLIGCIIGAAAAGNLADLYGRRRLLLIAALLFAASSILAAIPRTLSEFVIARFVGGLGIGTASVIAPVYIAELSPAHLRGRLVSLNQLAIVSGILLAYTASWMLSELGSSSWRWMFASALVPALGFLFALLGVPESPRWLVKEGRIEEALAVLTKVRQNTGTAQAELCEIERAVAEESSSFAELFRRPLRRPLAIATMLAILQQITGVNTILFYGALIFTEQLRSQAPEGALLANVVIGTTNFVFTLVALSIIDRVGRRPILLLASSGMTGSLILLGALFRWQPSEAKLILSAILTYVAFFAVGMGPGVWVVISELFPTRVRGRAAAIATVALWSACTFLTMTFLSLVDLLSAPGAFWLYAAISAGTFWYVYHHVPETRGKTLEEIERSWFEVKNPNGKR